jgi:RNA polymerase sigma-70 factor (ECF subfamily)
VPTDWAEVYRVTFPDLVRFLYHKVWEADRAEDLAQEAFVRALPHDPENPRAFVFTVAANLARDEARTAIRRRKHLELVKAEPVTHTESPADGLERREQERAVQAALAQLSERDREVLLLWDAGLDYDEIAAQTGLARSAIGTTLTRARRRLVEAHRGLGGRTGGRADGPDGKDGRGNDAALG